MILKRDENNGIIKAVYNSSNVLASTYDTNTKKMIIVFKSGSQYEYEDVSNTDYMRFEIAESQGSIFNSHIKKYKFTKLENVDPSKIITETIDLKEKEKKLLIDSKRLQVINTIKNIMLINENSNIDYSKLDKELIKLKEDIEKYFVTINYN